VRRLLAAALAFLAAAASAEEAAKILDPRPAARVGVAALKEKGLDDRQSVFAKTIPLRIRAELAAVLERTLDVDEVDAYRENARRAALFEAGKSLDAETDARDKVLFTEASERSKRKSVAEAQKKIEARMDDIAAKEALGLLLIDVKAKKPVELATKGDELLLPASSRFPAAASAVNDVDIMVTGTLTGLEDYMVLEIWCYHRFLRRELFSWKSAVAIDDTEETVAKIAEALAAVLSGAASGRLVVRARPDTADIYVDGVYRGRGSVEMARVSPGAHAVEARARGYVPAGAEIVVPAGGSGEREIALEENGLPPFTLSTAPDGAAVYLGAEYVGSSPAEIAAAEGLVSGRARMEGMEDALFAADGLSGETVSIELEAKPADGVTPLQKARDRFYSSNAYFLVSLPFTVVAVGAFISAIATWDEAAAGYEEGRYSAAEYETAREAMLETVIVAGPAAAACTGITAWFLGQSIVRLGKYLRAARK